MSFDGEVSFAVEPSEVGTYLRIASQRRVVAGQASRVGMFFLWIVVGMGLYYAFVALGLDSRSVRLLLFGFVAGLFSVVAVVLLRTYASFRSISIAPILVERRTISWSERGIRHESDLQSAEWPWRAFEAVSRERGLILLWLAPQIGFTIPERAFGSAASCETFIKLACERVAAARGTTAASGRVVK